MKGLDALCPRAIAVSSSKCISALSRSLPVLCFSLVGVASIEIVILSYHQCLSSMSTFFVRDFVGPEYSDATTTHILMEPLSNSGSHFLCAVLMEQHREKISVEQPEVDFGVELCEFSDFRQNSET